jgi:hypothetical protein
MIACVNPPMKSLLPFVALVGLMSFFSGCTTGPSYRSVKDSFPPLAAGAGRIFIYRDAIYNPAKMPTILLNDKPVGVSKAQGFFYVDQPADEYKIELVGEGGPPCNFSVRAGQTVYVRISLHSNLVLNHQYPEVVDASIAEREIANCKYVGAALK